MLKNYFLVAVRNLLKNKSYAFTNVMGLAVGMTVTLLILFYINYEMSYENFHDNMDDIYRVSITSLKEGKIEGESFVFVPPLGPALYEKYPEVENYVRVSVPYKGFISHGDEDWKVENLRYADSTFFRMFSFKLLDGDPNTSLKNPYTIVISESLSLKIFNSKNALGRNISLDGTEYMVTGIIQDSPRNTHLQYDAVASFITLYSEPNRYMGWRGGNQYISYVQLNKNSHPGQLEDKMPELMWEKMNSWLKPYGFENVASLQPLKDIHLYYNADNPNLLANIYIFSIIVFLVTLIASVNFINLSVSNSIKRFKEVGVRKVLGSNRSQLIFRYVSEAVIIIVSAVLIALIFIEMLLPFYNSFMNTHVQLRSVLELDILLLLSLIIVLMSIISGGYPAFYLSSISVSNIYKGSYSSSKKSNLIKNSLIIFQFAVSVGLLISTLVISSQLDFIKNKDLGFNHENIVVFDLPDSQSRNSYKQIKSELEKMPGVLSSSASSEVPYRGFTSNGYIPEGYEKPIMINVVDIDNDFLTTYNLKTLSGRTFEERILSDKDAYMINESLAKQLGWNDVAGKTIRRSENRKVIGVVNDFNFATLHETIKPLIFANEGGESTFKKLSVKIMSANVATTIDEIAKVIGKFSTVSKIEYMFLDDALNQVYLSETKFRDLFSFYASIAIIISLVGLISLTSLTAEQRTKEIGIRKTLGSSLVGLIFILTKDFIRLVLISNIIAWPIVYYYMGEWLSQFAYKVNPSVSTFLISSLAAVIIAVFTVSYQALKTALANPAETLKYE